METLKIKKLDPDAKVPERATSGSAGLDLCALLKEPLTLSCGCLLYTSDAADDSGTG